MICIISISCCKDSWGEGRLQSHYFLTTGKQRTAGSVELIAGNSEMERSTQNAVQEYQNYYSPTYISSLLST